MFGSHVTLLIISNKEMNDIIKIVKSLKESSLLITGISETIQNQAKGKKNRISPNVITHNRSYFTKGKRHN